MIRMIRKGIVEDKNGTPRCEKCGNDLRVDGSVELGAHIDRKYYFGWIYKCNKCGAKIELLFDRGESTWR